MAPVALAGSLVLTVGVPVPSSAQGRLAMSAAASAMSATASAVSAAASTASATNAHARAIGSTDVPHRLRGRAVTVLPTRRRVVALTIDCGSANDGVAHILRTLRRSDVTATFFVTGQFAKKYPSDVHRIAAAGHTIGNHSTTHPDFRNLSPDRRRSEIRRANRFVSAQSGSTTRPWFRFPYGSYDSAAIQQANDLGYAVIGWTVDTLGWMGTSGGQSVASVRRKAVAAARPGEIVLMHAGATPGDGSTLDADAMAGIIRGLKSKGYGFVPLQVPSRTK